MDVGARAQKALGRTLLAAGIALAVGAGVVQAVREARESEPLAAGTPAPALVAPRLDGTPVALASLRGRAVLLSFFATWCGPCAEEMPGLRALAREQGPRGLELLAASVDDDEPGRPAKIARFFERDAGPLPLVVFPADGAVHAWRAMQLPTLYVLGRDGRVVASHVGLAAPETLRREVEAALAAPRS